MVISVSYHNQDQRNCLEDNTARLTIKTVHDSWRLYQPSQPHMTTNNDYIFNGFDNDYNYNYDDDYYGVDSNSNSDSDEGILILLIFGAFLVTLGCCYYKASQSSSSQNNNRSETQHDRDLHQIRQRLSERGNRPRVGVTSGGDTSDDSIAVDRKELIKKNLFTRVIQREESVRELCEVLSISRGGYEVDEELGVCGSAAVDRTTTSSPSEPAEPSPSAPCLESDIDGTIAAQSEQTTESTLMRVNRLLANLIGSEREDGLFSNISLEPQLNNTKTTKKKQEVINDNNNNTKQLECSICLECYSPNDTIAWAKDGGTNSSDAGCDHIFHSECLFAWLEQHSDCPLCRRVILHEDADTRFDLW